LAAFFRRLSRTATPGVELRPDTLQRENITGNHGFLSFEITVNSVEIYRTGRQ